MSGLRHEDLKELYSQTTFEDLRARILKSMERIGYNKAFRENGYTRDDLDSIISDSVVPGFCYYCLAESSIEPDGHHDCHDCGIGYVKSIPVIMGVI